MKSLRSFLFTGVLLLFFIVFVFFRFEIIKSLGEFNSILAGFFNRSFNYQSFEDLKLENESLKKTLEEFKNNPLPIKERFRYIEASIYSRYPFNDKNLLTINRGSEDGIGEGMPVLADKNIILGKIKSVKRTQSEVETIFDSSWRTSVALGKNNIRALFVGGFLPEIQLIPKDAKVILGEEVTNLSKDYPLGLFFGRLKEVDLDSSGVWQIGKIDLPFDLANLEKVLVILDFP